MTTPPKPESGKPGKPGVPKESHRPSFVPHLEPFERDWVDKRAEFAMEELAAVLSHYDLGVIHSIRKYPRGSRRSPKVKIQSDRGDFLLKRRAPGRDDEARVEFTHRLQDLLHQRGFPVPRLVNTRQSSGSGLRLHEALYELFAYVRGRRFDLSVIEARQSGIALGQFHRIMEEEEAGSQLSGPGYQGQINRVENALHQVPAAITRINGPSDSRNLEPICQNLRQRYAEAARIVQDSGYPAWTRLVNHGDWHPGNLLFSSRTLVAVLDFDTARYEPRVADVANALLQFSMSLGRVDNPSGELDESLISAVLKGYDSATHSRLRETERRVLPWLMIEALIMECVLPIAATGSFGRISGFSFLTTANRTVEWIQEHAHSLTHSRGG